MSYWSFSRIDTYRKCPFKYFLKYIRKIYLSYPNNAVVFGNGFGDFVEYWAINENLTLEQALNIYFKTCLKHKCLDDINEIKKLSNIIRQYYEGGYRIDPLIIKGKPAAEYDIKFKLVEEPFGGKIDIIRYDHAVLDYKSQKEDTNYPYTLKDLLPTSEKGLQLMIYCLGYLREFKKIPPYRGFRVVVKSNPIQVKDLIVPNKKSELIKARNYLEEIVIKILEAKSFPKNPSGLCPYCDYYKKQCNGRY